MGLLRGFGLHAGVRRLGLPAGEGLLIGVGLLKLACSTRAQETSEVVSAESDSVPG